MTTKNIVWLAFVAIAFLCIGLMMGSIATYLLLQDQATALAPATADSGGNLTLPTPATPSGDTSAPPSGDTSPAEPSLTPIPTPPAEPVEVTPGATYEDAVGILAGQYTGQVHKGEEDWYKFEILSGHILKLALTPGGEADTLEINIIDSNRGDSWNIHNIVPPSVATFDRIMSSASTGTYYLQIMPGYSGSGGSYTLDLSWEPQNDANQGQDAGDDADRALTIPLEMEAPVTIPGLVGNLDEVDWYKFDLPNSGILNLAFSPHGKADVFNIILYDSNRGEIWNEHLVEPPASVPLNLMMNSSSGGIYYVEVEPSLKGGQGRYALDLSLQNQNDASTGSDAGDEPVQGIEIGADQALTGIVGDLDDFDCYKFTPVVGQIVSFTPGEETNGMGIQLFNADIREIWHENRVGPTINKTFQLDEVSGGPYYFCVGNQGSYTVEVKSGG
jgi:hypothetical protein